MTIYFHIPKTLKGTFKHKLKTTEFKLTIVWFLQSILLAKLGEI